MLLVEIYYFCPIAIKILYLYFIDFKLPPKDFVYNLLVPVLAELGYSSQQNI